MEQSFNPEWAITLPKLACPSDTALLSWEDVDGTSLRCPVCRARYPVVDQVPILIDNSLSLFDPESLRTHPPRSIRKKNWKAKISTLIPTIAANYGAEEHIASFLALLDGVTKPRILVVGGGEVGAGLQNVLDDARFMFTELDIYWGDRVNVLADAHNLPFEPETFDGVVCQAVLEHVVSPNQCVREMRRVLKAGAPIFLDLPFLWPVHMGAYDYTRFTLTGLRVLARGFDELDAGVSAGPAQMLALAVHHFVRSLSYSKVWTAVVSGLLPFFIFWLKYVDRLLIRRKASSDAAAGLYFMGTKNVQERSVRNIIHQYWRFKQLGPSGIR